RGSLRSFRTDVILYSVFALIFLFSSPCWGTAQALFPRAATWRLCIPGIAVSPQQECEHRQNLVLFSFPCDREERIAKEAEEEQRQKLKAVENKAKIMEAFLKEKEKEVLQLQEEAKTFITLENLDARIEQCLDNPRNYNFAIDKDGRIVKRTVLT
uniref:Small ribosomal subunit protein mS26 n=2 Tax=Athene cunicularia TaxID=194338 RepID=A0A663NC12_ATHCN